MLVISFECQCMYCAYSYMQPTSTVLAPKQGPTTAMHTPKLQPISMNLCLEQDGCLYVSKDTKSITFNSFLPPHSTYKTNCICDHCSLKLILSNGTCSILQKELHRCCVPWKTKNGCIRGAWFNKWKQAVQIHYRSCSDVQLSLNVQYDILLITCM